jgi:hypothetical protein
MSKPCSSRFQQARRRYSDRGLFRLHPVTPISPGCNEHFGRRRRHLLISAEIVFRNCPKSKVLKGASCGTPDAIPWVCCELLQRLPAKSFQASNAARGPR